MEANQAIVDIQTGSGEKEQQSAVESTLKKEGLQKLPMSRIEQSIRKKLGAKAKLNETEFEVILLDGV